MKVSEDWLAVIIGFLIVLCVYLGVGGGIKW